MRAVSLENKLNIYLFHLTNSGMSWRSCVDTYNTPKYANKFFGFLVFEIVFFFLQRDLVWYLCPRERYQF